MLLLAIESATAAASVALVRGDEILASRAAPAGRPASESLLPTALALLDECGVGLAELGAFAVSIGPGSFTGLRVGVATVKGLAFGGAQPVIAVPTLAALAARVPGPAGTVAALLDARRGEVYAAVYDGDPIDPPRAGPAVWSAARVAEALLASDGPCAAVGDGVPVVAVELARRCGERVALLPPPAGSPDAAAVGRLAARLLARGAGVPAEHLAPLYVRRAEAEVRRTGERFERFDTPGEVS